MKNGRDQARSIARGVRRVQTGARFGDDAAHEVDGGRSVLLAPAANELTEVEAVDVGAWARPLVGRRVDPGAPSRPITSIRSSTGFTNPGTNPHITATGLATPGSQSGGFGSSPRTGAPPTEPGVVPKPVAQTVVGAPLFDVNAEDLDLDDL